MTALPYLYLGCAVVLEVIGTSALKMSDSFTRLIPSIVSLAAYGAALALLAIVLRSIPVGIAYAVWAGMGIVLITLVGWLWFKQPLDVPAMLGLGLIILGVIVVQGFSQTLHH